MPNAISVTFFSFALPHASVFWFSLRPKIDEHQRRYKFATPDLLRKQRKTKVPLWVDENDPTNRVKTVAEAAKEEQLARQAKMDIDEEQNAPGTPEKKAAPPAVPSSGRSSISVPAKTPRYLFPHFQGFLILFFSEPTPSQEEANGARSKQARYSGPS